MEIQLLPSASVLWEIKILEDKMPFPVLNSVFKILWLVSLISSLGCSSCVMDCSGSSSSAMALPNSCQDCWKLKEQQQNRNQRQQLWWGGMEKISLSIFSHLHFPSGMVLKPSAGVENNISPFVLVGEKGRIPSCWEKMFLRSPTKVFSVVGDCKKFSL